eukprot:2822541-Pyramimonas_sp.AAC.1
MFTDCERVVFKMWLSAQRRAHSFSNFARVSRIPKISVPAMVFWKDSGLSGHSSYVDSVC